MKLYTNGALILVRLGKVSLRHTEIMIPRGRVDEITKEPKTDSKRVTGDPVAAWAAAANLRPSEPFADMARALVSADRCPSVRPLVCDLAWPARHPPCWRLVSSRAFCPEHRARIVLMGWPE